MLFEYTGGQNPCNFGIPHVFMQNGHDILVFDYRSFAVEIRFRETQWMIAATVDDYDESRFLNSFICDLN
jgi:hypothetical protein